MMKRMTSLNWSARKFGRVLGLTSSLLALGLPALVLPALVLTACSTATLIGASIDMASFVPSIARAQTVPLPAIGTVALKPLDDRDGNPNNGFLIETPISSIDIIEAFNAEVDLRLGSSSPSGVKLELFIAPNTETDIYKTGYLVASDDKTIAAGGSETVVLKFNLQPGSALDLVKSGKFRLGLSLSIQTSSLGSFTYSLNKAVAGVKGYPAKLITR
jgi:hypothetical protein